MSISNYESESHSRQLNNVSGWKHHSGGDAHPLIVHDPSATFNVGLDIVDGDGHNTGDPVMKM